MGSSPVAVRNKVDRLNNQMKNTIGNRIQRTENRTNANLQKGSKKKQEEKTQMNTNQVPKHIERRMLPAFPSTININQTDKTSKKFNTIPAIQNTNNSRKKYIIMLIDSNRKFVDFRELLLNEVVDVGQIVAKPCGNMRKIEVLVKILTHVGVSDIDDQYPEEITNNVVTIAKNLQEKFKCNIHLSDITPQNDYFKGHVQAVNQTLAYKMSKRRIIATCQIIVNVSEIRGDEDL